MAETQEQSTPAARQDGQGVPAKCIACNRALSSVIVCDACHTLNPISAPTDYFQLVGVPRRFNLDETELRRKYLALNRHVHPDFHTADDLEGRELALAVAAALNDAYRTLNEPISRAGYLVELLGGKSSADDKSTPEGFLGEMMLLQEDLVEAKAEGDSQTVEKMARAMGARFDEMAGQLKDLFAEFDDQLGCEAVRLDGLNRIRKQLNAISYIKRLIDLAGER